MAVQLFTISESDWKSGLSTVKTTGKTVLAGLTSLFLKWLVDRLIKLYLDLHPQFCHEPRLTETPGIRFKIHTGMVSQPRYMVWGIQLAGQNHWLVEFIGRE